MGQDRRRFAVLALSARLNKSDASDAEGLAQLARTNWFTPVHIRSEDADRLRSLIGARERLIRLRKDLEGHIRGMLKTFGIRMIGVGQGRQRQGFRDQLAAAGETDPILRAIADGFIAVHSTLCQAAADLECAVKATHRPTGLSAVAREERSQHRNKALALERLQHLMAAQAAADEAAQKASRNELHYALERGNPVRCFKGRDFREVKGGYTALTPKPEIVRVL